MFLDDGSKVQSSIVRRSKLASFGLSLHIVPINTLNLFPIVRTWEWYMVEPPINKKSMSWTSSKE